MTSHWCNTVRELLVDYSDGELPEADRLRVAAHLAGCPECRSEMALLERSLELARAVWDQSAAQAPSAVSGAFPARRRPLRVRAVAVLATGAAGLLLAVGAWWLVHVRPQDKTGQTDLAGPAQPSLETGPPGPPLPAEEAEIEALIARTGRAARLAALAELLATQPGLDTHRQQTERYLAEAYRGTPAGDRAARRIGLSTNREPES